MFKLNNLSSLQLFQLIRYSTFVLINIGFAKLQLPKTEIGQFETFILISGMVSFFWVSGIINSMLSIYPKKTEEEKKDVLFNTFLSLVLFSFLAGTALMFFSRNLLAFLNKENESRIVNLSIIYLLLNNPSFVIEYIFFLNHRKKALLIYACVTAIVTVLIVIFPVLLHAPIEHSLYGLILVAAIRIFYALVLLKRFAAFRLKLQLQAANLKLSAPIIGSIFVSGSAEYIDGIIVKSKFDDVFFAIYRYGAKELPVLLIIANTFSTAMIPAISANLQDGLSELKKRSARLMHIFFPLTIILMMVSPYIYKYVFNESFLYSALIFDIYLLLVIPRVLFPQTILTGIGQTKFLFISSVLEIIINVSLSIYLAVNAKMGLPGVALGTFIAYSFDKIFLIAINRFYFGISPAKYVQLMPYFVYVFLTFVFFFLGLLVLKNC